MNKEPIIKKVDKSNEFVGMRIEDGEINLYVPQVFRKEQNYKRDLLLFLKSISLIGNPDKEKLNKGSDDTKDFWPIDTFNKLGYKTKINTHITSCINLFLDIYLYSEYRLIYC